MWIRALIASALTLVASCGLDADARLSNTYSALQEQEQHHQEEVAQAESAPELREDTQRYCDSMGRGLRVMRQSCHDMMSQHGGRAAMMSRQDPRAERLLALTQEAQVQLDDHCDEAQESNDVELLRQRCMAHHSSMSLILNDMGQQLNHGGAMRGM